MNAPEISVVMANHNGRRYLGSAIRSLQAQTLKSWELIFVDDASGDGSVEAAEEFARSDPRITVLAEHINRGPAAVRNRAIAVARGQWLVVFDSDDLMRPRRLEMLRDRAKSDRALLVVDNLLVFSSREPDPKPFLPKRFATAPRWIGLADYIDSNRLYSRTPDLGYLKPLINRDLLWRSGIFYDERLRIGEDYDLIARLLATGVRLRLEPSAQYLYRKHSSSISHRIRSDSIIALIEANERLADHIGVADSDVALALARRRKSLQSMLLYDRVIGMLKVGDYGQAVAASLRSPQIWPLLTRPVSARIRRLRWKKHPSRFAVPSLPLVAD